MVYSCYLSFALYQKIFGTAILCSGKKYGANHKGEKNLLNQ